MLVLQTATFPKQNRKFSVKNGNARAVKQSSSGSMGPGVTGPDSDQDHIPARTTFHRQNIVLYKFQDQVSKPCWYRRDVVPNNLVLRHLTPPTLPN